MKILIIGGNRFVGLRLSHLIDRNPAHELHILNRTGQVPHTKNAILHKGDRKQLSSLYLDKDWDVIVDFAGYNREDAEGALSFFGKVQHYIFISTVSVYDSGSNLKEADFDPHTHPLGGETPSDPGLAYQFGKRQAEAVFAQGARFPTTLVRFPLILGPDDYTHRLDFHIERIQNAQPIYIPNLKAKIPMIHSGDAASTLSWLIENPRAGPLNVASPSPISLAELIGRIEALTGKKALLINHDQPQTHSPYGMPHDLVINTDKLDSLGVKLPSISSWLDELIELSAGGSSASPRKGLH